MPALTALCPDFSTMQGRKQAASAGVSCFSCISSLSSNARQSSKTFKRQVVLARGSQSLTTHHLYNNGACQQFRSPHILCKAVSRRGEQKHNMPWEGRARCAHRKRRSRDAIDSLLIGGQLSHDHVHGFYVLLEVLREEQGPACSESSASAKIVSAMIQENLGRLGTSCSEGSLYLRASDARGPSSVTSASSSSSPGASNLPALALNLRARSSFLVLSARHPAPAPAAAASAGHLLDRSLPLPWACSLRNAFYSSEQATCPLRHF